ncbi:MAG: nucleotide exchange factor GrpE [Candidatus Margulisiibacteriota bacterium]
MERHKEKGIEKDLPKEVLKELPPEESKNEIDVLNEQIKEEKNKHLRTLADFDNYKKRMALEKDTLLQFGNERLITELLPVMDNFDRALEAADKTGIAEDVIKGLALTKKLMEDTLKKFGVTEILAKDQPYDANVHEAMMQQESDKPEGTILEVAQKGYKLHDRVIRPSMVIVSKGK